MCKFTKKHKLLAFELKLLVFASVMMISRPDYEQCEMSLELTYIKCIKKMQHEDTRCCNYNDNDNSFQICKSYNPYK